MLNIDPPIHRGMRLEFLYSAVKWLPGLGSNETGGIGLRGDSVFAMGDLRGFSDEYYAR
jgi:hypothetical protein